MGLFERRRMTPPLPTPQEQAVMAESLWLADHELYDEATAHLESHGLDRARLKAWIATGLARVADGPPPGFAAAEDPTRLQLPATCDPVRDAARIRQWAAKHAPGCPVQTVIIEDDRWVAVLGEPSPRPLAQIWQLDPGVRPTDGERLAAHAREQGLSLAHFDPHSQTAVVAAIDPYVTELRSKIAGHLGATVRPWDVEILLEWQVVDGHADPVVLHVLRMPPIADPERRRQTWISLCEQLLPCPANTNWWVEDDSQHGRLTVRRAEDPLGTVQTYPWQVEPMYTAIPFATAVNGSLVSLGLLESNMLLGGIPGSGKSGGATALLSGIARLPHVALVGLDPKRVELSLWGPRFSRIAKRDEDATLVLQALLEEMERRYEWLEDRGLKKVSEAELSDDLPLIVMLIDELADLVSVGVTTDEKKAEAERSTMIRRLIAKGRAAGVVVIAATQKPQSDVVPTALRDLIQQRVGYATTTDAMTDTILGAGMCRTGGLCHEIPSSLRGVCYIVNESSRTPIRARTFWIPDEQVAGIAEQYANLRVDLPWMPAPGQASTGRGGTPTHRFRVIDDPVPEPEPEPMVDLGRVHLDFDLPAPADSPGTPPDDLWG